jgi:hypothetical protein
MNLCKNLLIILTVLEIKKRTLKSFSKNKYLKYRHFWKVKIFFNKNVQILGKLQKNFLLEELQIFLLTTVIYVSYTLHRLEVLLKCKAFEHKSLASKKLNCRTPYCKNISFKCFAKVTYIY